MNQKKPNKTLSKTVDHDKEILSDLLEKTALLHDSINWWDDRISEIVSEIDRLEALPWSPEIEKDIYYNQNKLKKFLKRGDSEMKNIDRLEKDIQDFFLKWGTA